MNNWKIQRAVGCWRGLALLIRHGFIAIFTSWLAARGYLFYKVLALINIEGSPQFNVPAKNKLTSIRIKCGR